VTLATRGLASLIPGSLAYKRPLPDAELARVLAGLKTLYAIR